MKKEQFEYLKKYFEIDLSEESCQKLALFFDEFQKYGATTNLMSKGDLALLFEKHIFDSFGILKCRNFDPNKKTRVLDIGTGGGLPSVPLAICFPNLNIVAIDSVSRKINFIQDFIKKAELKNLETVWARAENISPLGVDLIVSRAVGTMKYIVKNSKKHLKTGGKFIFWKGTKEIFEAEIKELVNSEKKFRGIMPKIYSYELPTEEHHKRHIIEF